VIVLPDGLLEDQEAFIALSNYVISDLLDDEPDIYTIDDVKVRFMPMVRK